MPQAQGWLFWFPAGQTFGSLQVAVLLVGCFCAPCKSAHLHGDDEADVFKLDPGSIDVEFIPAKDIRKHVDLIPPSPFTWCVGIVILLVVPVFLINWHHITRRLRDPLFGKTARETVEFEGYVKLDLVGEDSPTQRWSLRFKEKETEEKFVRDSASEVCRKGRLVVCVAIVYSLHAIFFNLDEHAVPKFMPIFTSWNSSARVLFTCSWIHIFTISCVTLWLTIICSNDRRKKFVERILMSWCSIVCLMLMTVANRYLCARVAGESPRRTFTHYSSDDATFNQVMAMLVFISVYTPIRHHLIVTCSVVIFFFYFMTCLCFGSPDGALWNIAFGSQNYKIFGRIGWIQFDRILWFGLLLLNLLLGQRSIETRRRQDFLSLLNSQKMIDDLRNAEDESKGTSALEQGRKSLDTALKRLLALQDHKVVNMAGLGKDLGAVYKLVEEGKKSLENADRLYHFNVHDLLKDFDSEYKDNKDLHAFAAMTGSARARQTNVEHTAQVSLPKGTSRGTMHQSMQKVSSLTSFGRVSSERPQASKQELKAFEFLKDVGENWDFDPLTLARETGNRALAHVAEVVVVKAQWRSALGESPRSEEKLRAFVRELHRRYPANEYHNEAHAANVAHMALWFATETGYMDTMATDSERMSLMLAALGHDVGHFGRNSLFCLNTRHTVAMLWNDSSVLENMHAATVFNITDKEGCDIFSSISVKEMGVFRKLIISFILITDLKSHQESIMKFSARKKADDFLKRPEHDDHVDRWIDDKQLLGNMIMQCSDIGHAGCSWEMHKEWSFRVVCEFFEQGDEEKRLGLPVSPLCERHNYNIVGNQSFFIDFIACSCIKQLEAVASDNGNQEIQEEVLNQCEENKKLWKQFYSEPGSFDSDSHNINTCGRALQAPCQPIWPYDLPAGPLPGMRPVDNQELLKELSAYRPQARSVPVRIG